MVEDRRPGKHHADGLAADVLEAAAGPCPVHPRPDRSPRLGGRPHRASAGTVAPGPALVADDLAGGPGADSGLEPAALWPAGDDPGRLAVRARPELAGPR